MEAGLKKDETDVGAHRHAPFFHALQTGAPTPFHTPAYLMAYRRYFGGGKTFHRIQIEGGAAFLQLRGRTVKRLEWWGAGIHDIGGAIYDSPDVAREMWSRIGVLASRCDGAHLAQIPADCAMIDFAREPGWKVQDAETCPVLQLPPTWDEYLKLLGKNMREQIKRYPKRLEKEFRVEYSLAQTQQEVQIALDDLFRLHGQRWRARGQTGVLATPRRQEFHRRVCAAFLKKDQLRLWTLRCNEKAVCVLLFYFYGRRSHFFIGGFDPEYSRWSVGTCLFARAIRSSIEEGVTALDFLKGEEEYKYRLGAKNILYKTISTYQNSPRGRFLQKRIALEEAFMRKLHEKFSAAHRNPKS